MKTEVKRLGSKGFKQMLQSKKFQKFKAEVIDFYSQECGQCGSKYHLRIYFKTFINPTNIKLGECIVLCRKHGTQFLKERKKGIYGKSKDLLLPIPNHCVKNLLYQKKRNEIRNNHS